MTNIIKPPAHVSAAVRRGSPSLIILNNQEHLPMSTLETVLITGASTGIGATYAERFAQRGHNLVLVARDKSRLDALALRLREKHAVSIDVIQADLTQTRDLPPSKLACVMTPVSASL
jgi:NAD(P)-dependent dehydrogenase (short-subunit alcohol dehydrogenase family)